MSSIHQIIAKLELAQLCWVVPDIRAAVQFLSGSLGNSAFPEPSMYNAEDLKMSYMGKIVEGRGLTTQAHNGVVFMELIQPLSGESMFHDYLAAHPQGGIQHIAYRLPVEDFEAVTNELRGQGLAVISEVDHPIARMAFFDTYHILGVVTEIMGITPEGWKAVKQMEKGA